MAGRPHMIMLFAHHIADTLEPKLGARPAVHVVSIGAVNYRPPQWFIDPRINLAGLKPWCWVHDFVVDLVPLGVTEHPALVSGGKDVTGDDSKNRLFRAFGHIGLKEAEQKFAAAMRAFGRE